MGRYSVVMMDGGILQLEYMLKRGDILWHRLCFYPCPIEYDPYDEDEHQLAEIIEELDMAGWWDKARLRGPLRFDYHPKDATDAHPASHLHMVMDGRRVPVRSAGIHRVCVLELLSGSLDRPPRQTIATDTELARRDHSGRHGECACWSAQQLVVLAKVSSRSINVRFAG